MQPRRCFTLKGAMVWTLAACALAEASCSDGGRSRTAGDGARPIAVRYGQAGAAAALGAVTSGVLTTPDGSARYRTFEKGVIVQSDDWGAVAVSTAVFDRWLALQGQQNASGEDLFSYVGIPIRDSVALGAAEMGTFERGMIVSRPADGSTVLVEGPMYLHWWDVKGIGLPTGEEEAVSGGRHQSFENGEMYWRADVGAHALQGDVLDRWLAQGGPGGALGFPVSDVESDLGTAALATTARFQNGVIYASPATGTLEVGGEIRRAYEQRYGGPSGWLGLPIGPQRSTPTSGGVFQDFENGVVVSHPSGTYKGTYAFGRLDLYVQRIAGYGDDCACVPIIGCLCGSQDVFAYVRVNTLAGTVVDVRRPPSGDGGRDFEVGEGFPITQAVHGDLFVNVWVQAWDADDTSSDDELGVVSAEYSVDNLWGLFEAPEHGASNGGDSFKIWYSLRNTYPFDVTDFPKQVFWSFRNFSTETLTYDQYAATFSDVHPEENWWYHPFNALYYELEYKGVASDGNCQGMTLESIYAQKGRSLYSEPIFQYFDDTQDGAPLAGVDDAHRGLIGEINIKQGYQLGADEILYSAETFLSGATHDPVDVFLTSRAAAERGDDPTISIFDSYFFGDAHSVRPYRWDDSSKPWKMYVADPNLPPGTGAYTPAIIEVDPDQNTYRHTQSSNYSGGEWTGGRMFQIPFQIMGQQPRTPFWEVFELVAGGALFLVGDTGNTSQISDDAGHTFYQSGLGGPPTRWDQIQQDPASRIPGLARVPVSSGLGGRGAEVYFTRAAGATYRYEVGPRAGVPDGTSYDFLLNSGGLTSHLAVPGTQGVPDVITASHLGAAGKSVTLSIPAAGGAKEVGWTVAAGVKQRWTRLERLKMAPGQSLTTRLVDGGHELQLENDGPETTAQMTVQTGPGATPVAVGTITIPSGATQVRTDAPFTQLSYTGQAGNDGWLITPATVTLQALDLSGTGIARIETSTDGTTWTTYLGPFVYAAEGVTTLQYRAVDNTGAVEATKRQEFRIDTRAPIVGGDLDRVEPCHEHRCDEHRRHEHPHQPATRNDRFAVRLSFADPAPGSGLASTAADLDGTPVIDDQEVDLFWSALGTHTLTATALDVAGWKTVRSDQIELVATFHSLVSTIEELHRRGEIRRDQAQWLEAEVKTAAMLDALGLHRLADRALGELLDHLAAQAAKHLSQRVVDLLSQDVAYVRAHPRR